MSTIQNQLENFVKSPWQPCHPNHLYPWQHFREVPVPQAVPPQHNSNNSNNDDSNDDNILVVPTTVPWALLPVYNAMSQ